MVKSNKKFIALLLCLLLVCTFIFAACGNDATSDESKASAGSNNEVSNETSKEEDRVRPDFKWTDKDTFTVLVVSNEVETTYFSEEIETLYDTTDDAIKQAVNSRNDNIYSKYGVNIKARAVSSLSTTFNSDKLAGTLEYDAIMPFLQDAVVFAQNGDLYDLYDYEDGGYIDLSQDYWDQNANDSLSISGRLFFTTGDLSIMQKIVSTSILYNPDLLAQKRQDMDLYEMVRNKTWTMDVYFELAKEFTQDNGDGIWDKDDTWGVSGSIADVNFYYMSTGNRLCDKDTEDEPVFSLDENANRGIAATVLEYQKDGSSWGIFAENLPDADRWVISLDIFGEGRALFRTSAFSAVKKLRNYDATYGFLPYPLYNSEQEDYYSPCSARYAYGVAIPKTVADPEFSAYMLDVLAEESSGLATAYYDVVLKSKDAQRDADEEMLDEYIFKNIVYDIGHIYNFGSVNSLITDVAKDPSAELTSTIDSKRSVIESAIKDVVEAYKLIK